jgi:large subunit ribosomal protein L15
MSLPLTSLLYRNAKTWAPVNLDRLQHWIDQGRITSSPEQPITARELLLSKCIHNVHDGIKILGDVSSLNLMVICPGYYLQNFQGP